MKELTDSDLRSIQDSADEFEKADSRWKAYWLKLIECHLLKGHRRIELQGAA